MTYLRCELIACPEVSKVGCRRYLTKSSNCWRSVRLLIHQPTANAMTTLSQSKVADGEAEAHGSKSKWRVAAANQERQNCYCNGKHRQHVHGGSPRGGFGAFPIVPILSRWQHLAHLRIAKKHDFC
jgi:hypothetical protein